MSTYRRTIIQGPTNYQELNKSRPTRKRNFNYTYNDTITSQHLNTTVPNHLSKTTNDYSFENKESHDRATSIVPKELEAAKKHQPSASYLKVGEECLPKSPPKQCNIGQRLNNISSINDKITGLLNVPRSKRNQSSSEYSSPKRDHLGNTGKTFVSKERAPTYTSRFVFGQDESKKEKEKLFKSKYAYTPEEDTFIPRLDITSKNYQNDHDNSSFSTKERKYDLDFKYKTTQGILHVDTPAQSQRVQLTVTPYSQKPSHHSRTLKQALQTQNQTDKYKTVLGEKSPNLWASMEKKQKTMVENMVLDKQIKDLKDKFFTNSPLRHRASNILERGSPPKKAGAVSTSAANPTASPMFAKVSQESQIVWLAQNLSRIVEVDRELFKYREGFESIKDEDKWKRINFQLHFQKVYMQEKDIKDLIQISIQEKNPFNSSRGHYSLNQVRDMARLFAEAANLWDEQLNKCVSLQALAAEDFSLSSIDISTKGSIGLQDLTCFININSQHFYRGRDVVPLFKRFLKLEQKSLEKDISAGMLYSTFMQKVAK